jgi:hypothetical protein
MLRRVVRHDPTIVPHESRIVPHDTTMVPHDTTIVPHDARVVPHDARVVTNAERDRAALVALASHRSSLRAKRNAGVSPAERAASRRPAEFARVRTRDE